MQEYGLRTDESKKPFSKGFWGLCYLAFVITMALAASAWITQRIAHAYGYHPALGLNVGGIYAPWQWISWYLGNPSAQVIDDALAEGQLLFVIPQLIVMGCAVLFSRRPKGRQDIHGSAHWARKEDIERAGLFSGKGVYVGAWLETLPRRWWQFSPVRRVRYLRYNDASHVLAFAPTRSGKGVGLVLPTLLSWAESALILDIKGENWALTAGWRAQQGHAVLRFDPQDYARSVCFNPIDTVRITEPQAVQDAQAITTMILDPDGKGMKEYFDKAAFAFFVGAILHCIIVQIHEGKKASMRDLSFMLANPDMTTDELLESMIETDHAVWLREAFPDKELIFADALHDNIASSAKEMLNKADRERSGVLSTAGVNLSLYRDPTIAHVTSRSDFTVADLMQHEKPVSLYFIISPNDLDRLRPLTRLILNVILNRLTEHMAFQDGRAVVHYRHRLLLMLDEFTSLGNLAIFERALAFMAGYGLKAYIIIQDLSQLHGAYTKDESIMSNCHLRLAYAPNKPQTASLLSEMTGKTTVVEEKTSLSGSRSGHLKNASVSIAETARPLLTPDECGRLPGITVDRNGKVIDGGDMLIFAAGFPAIYGKQILYFQDPVFLSRAKIPAPERSHTLVQDKTVQRQQSTGRASEGNSYATFLASADAE